MELTEERKNEKRFHTGRLMAVVGAGIIAYCWIKGKFKDLSNNFFLTDGKQEGCLVINDENESEYIQDHANEAYYLPICAAYRTSQPLSALACL